MSLTHCPGCKQRIESVVSEEKNADSFSWEAGPTKVYLGRTVYFVPCGCVLTPNQRKEFDL